MKAKSQVQNSKQNNVNKWSYYKKFFYRLKSYFDPKFVDINNQKVSKKFPWLLVFSWIAGSILFILLIRALNPNFKLWNTLWKEIIPRFFDTNKEATIYSTNVNYMGTFIYSLQLLWRTIAYSVLGTIFGIILSIPIALLCSKNFIKNPYIYFPMRLIMSIVRAVPPVVFAFILFYLLTPDLAATFSIAIFVASIMAKWLYEDLDTYNVSSYQGLQAIGNTKYLAFKKSIMPYLTKRIFSYGFYSFEMVVRFAAILSVVGIQTIGILLQNELNNIDYYSHRSVVIWVIVAFIVCVEVLNYLVRRFILEYIPKHPRIEDKKSYQEQLKQLKKQKPKNYWYKIVLAIFILCFVFASLFEIRWGIVNEIKLGYFKQGIQKLFRPDWSLFASQNETVNVWKTGFQALYVAFVGAVIGLFFSIILGIFASKNITGKYFCLPFKLIIIVIRAIPPFTFAILFLFLVKNSNAFAGALALGIHSIGMLGKLITESVEKIDKKIFQSLNSVGANWWQKIRYGVLKEIMPQTLSNFLYRIEINFKTTVVLGVVGASPFGYQVVTYSGDLFLWDKLGAYLVFTIGLLLVLEQISNILRRKLISGYFFSQNCFIKRWYRKKIYTKALAICTLENIEFVDDYKYAKFIIAKYKYRSFIDPKQKSRLLKIFRLKFWIRVHRLQALILNRIHKIQKQAFNKAYKENKTKWKFISRLQFALKSKWNAFRQYIKESNLKNEQYSTFKLI